MLKDFEPQKYDKDAVTKEIKQLKDRFFTQQQLIRDAKIPVLVLVEGWSGAGKGSLIKELISEIDPRFYSVVSPAVIPEKEIRYPFLYPYAAAIPENGKIVFMDSGWMEDTVRKSIRHEITREEEKRRIRHAVEFERQLINGGYVVLKMFLHIDKKEQHERMTNLLKEKDTEWRVTDEDIWQHREYKRFRGAYEEYMDETAPWFVLDGSKRKVSVRDALKTIVTAIDEALEKGKFNGEPYEEEFPLIPMPLLKDVDLSPSIGDEEYRKQLKKLQAHLKELHNKIYAAKIPVILCYEGWDAAGKGGNIRRVAYSLDPRGFDVKPIASPLPHELARQFLWRFWTRLPRTGHICIFDRTWYGRVMVERLEGFCTENDWKRAYNEINEFERELTDWGAVVIKFWIHVDQETQLARFTERQNTPEKQWKITEEDWRNREKWPQYEVAVNEMLQKTSTVNAPWYIIESNDKQYARIKTLKIIVDTLEKAVRSRLDWELDV